MGIKFLIRLNSLLSMDGDDGEKWEPSSRQLSWPRCKGTQILKRRAGVVRALPLVSAAGTLWCPGHYLAVA